MDTPHASFTSTSYSPDGLLAGGILRARKVMVASGAGALARGSVLGKITKGAASVTPGAGNTGDGAAGDVTLGRLAKLGDYVLTCITAATNGGKFSVVDPDGERLADLVVGAAYTSEHINFTLADGDTDFAAGDAITITVAAGSGKYLASLAAAVDGSQEPDLILAADVAASAADAEALAYYTGDFAVSALTIGTGHTAASIREGLRAKGINLVDVVA